MGRSWAKFWSAEGRTSECVNVKLASYPLSDIGGGAAASAADGSGGGGGPAAVSPAGEVLPPKKQAVVERLRRRIESYRRHQNDCIPRFDHTFNGVVEQNLQDTLLLKQRFLENKAKRGIKKSEKKPPENNVPKFSAKRSASEDGEINGENVGDAPPSKNPQSGQKSNEGLTKFSVEIVQQLEFTTSTTNSHISTNVTVKALNTLNASSVKSDVPQSPNPPTPRSADIVECKREPENVDFVDLEQCAAAVEKDAAGGSSFPGFSDFICDETSDSIITSETFNDLISEISDFHPEFMKDFDFDGGDSKPQCNEELPKPEVMTKAQPSNVRSLPPNCPPNKLHFNPNVEFKAELSPAAQTLKQMAEQHQHKTQMGMGYNPPRPSPKPYEFQFGSNNDYSPSANSPSNQPNYKTSLASPPCTMSFNTDNIKKEVFSSQNSPLGFSPKREIPSPQHVRMNTTYKPQFQFTSPTPSGNNPSNFPPSRSQPTQSPCGNNSKPSPQPSKQQPPRPPSSGGANQFNSTNIQANQVQQAQLQGQVQVSMAQTLNGEMKGGNMSLAAQQAVFMSGNQSGFATATQSQTINFTQQSLRQRAPTKPTHTAGLRPSHPQVMDVMGGHLGGQHMGSRPGMPPLLRFQPRMVPVQPMPPSGPMMRASQGQFLGSQNLNNVHPRHHPYNSGKPRHVMAGHNAENPNWRQMMPQQQQPRPQFIQAQGVSFSSAENQLSAGQLQHSNMPMHQQTLGLQQVNPTMSLRVQMSQNMNTGSVFTTSNTRPQPSQMQQQQHQQHQQQQHRQPNRLLGPPTSSAQFAPSGSTNNYVTPSQFIDQSTGSPQHQQQTHQVQQATFQQTSLPSDFNLDFLEQFPTGDSSNFTEQEFLNSFEPSSSFNFQDIL